MKFHAMPCVRMSTGQNMQWWVTGDEVRRAPPLRAGVARSRCFGALLLLEPTIVVVEGQSQLAVVQFVCINMTNQHHFMACMLIRLLP
jgi:hypothetical protein